mmetsp:Transcript_51709/g.129764  ORF Transcript_51709/g.129764 Transcript_51709/m.129764 type:complete len:113 (-) Transcript_51709:12-350(-)
MRNEHEQNWLVNMRPVLLVQKIRKRSSTQAHCRCFQKGATTMILGKNSNMMCASNSDTTSALPEVKLDCLQSGPSQSVLHWKKLAMAKRSREEHNNTENRGTHTETATYVPL